MRHIYFVRHSLRDFTIREDREVPLTVEGLDLAKELKPYFVDKDISIIFSSPYLRAIQTIEPTAELLNINIVLEEELRERAVGDWVENFSEFSNKQWSDFDYKLENGESLNQVRQRIVSVYEKILKQEESNIIISGHGTSLAILFNAILDGDFGFEDFNKMKMPDIYCGVYSNNQLITFEHVLD